MKTPIIIFIVFLMTATMAFAAIQRSQPTITGGQTTVTYTTNGLIAASYGKAYWSVDENVASCSVTGASCSGTNVDCTYVGGAIRVVAYTPESGGAITKSIQVSVTGTGTCALTNGLGVESYDGIAGSASSVGGSATLTLANPQDTSADINSDGCVSFTELLSYANAWVAKTGPTFNNVLEAANRWVVRNKAIC